MGILKKLGFHSDAVANGAEAVRALETIPYDLVLMDVQMPEMDGLEATRRIRDPGSPVRDHAIPVIAMTAHAMRGDKERCLEAGMNDYLSKPVIPKDLEMMIRKWANPDDRGLSAPRPPAQTAGKKGEAPVFDEKVMDGSLMGDRELAAMILRTFLDDIPHQIDTLKEHAGSGAVREVERGAHTIKGAAANIGAERLKLTAYDIELMGKAEDLAAIRKKLPELEERFRELEEVLERKIEDAKAPG